MHAHNFVCLQDSHSIIFYMTDPAHNNYYVHNYGVAIRLHVKSIISTTAALSNYILLSQLSFIFPHVLMFDDVEQM